MRKAVALGVLVGLLPIIVLLVAARESLPPPNPSIAFAAGISAPISLTPPSANTASPIPRPPTRVPAPAGNWVHGLPLVPPIPAEPTAADTQSFDAAQLAAESADVPPPDVDLTPDAIVALEATARAVVAVEAREVPALAPGQVSPAQPAGGQSPTSRLGAAVPATIRRWEQPILRWSSINKVDPNLVAALMMTESQGDPQAVSPKGAVGLLQIVGGPTDPDANIRQGTEILKKNIAKYGRIDLALAAYNAGPGAVDLYNGIPPYRETRDHVFRVLLRNDLYKSR